MMHFWRYVGHLMGVRPRWYPGEPDRSGAALVRDAGEGREALRRRRSPAVPVVRARVRAGSGSAAARAPRGRIRASPPPRIHAAVRDAEEPPRLRPASRGRLGARAARDRAARRGDRARAAHRARRSRRSSIRAARRRRNRWFARQMGGRAAEYKPVEQLHSLAEATRCSNTARSKRSRGAAFCGTLGTSSRRTAPYDGGGCFSSTDAGP